MKKSEKKLIDSDKSSSPPSITAELLANLYLKISLIGDQNRQEEVLSWHNEDCMLARNNYNMIKRPTHAWDSHSMIGHYHFEDKVHQIRLSSIITESRPNEERKSLIREEVSCSQIIIHCVALTDDNNIDVDMMQRIAQAAGLEIKEFIHSRTLLIACDVTVPVQRANLKDQDPYGDAQEIELEAFDKLGKFISLGIPVIFFSSVTGEGVEDIFDKAIKIYLEKNYTTPHQNDKKPPFFRTDLLSEASYEDFADVLNLSNFSGLEGNNLRTIEDLLREKAPPSEENLKKYHLLARYDDDNKFACFHLGYLYLQGIGVKYDLKEGFCWIKKVADSRSMLQLTACLILAFLYKAGCIETEYEQEKAVAHLSALKQLNPEKRQHLLHTLITLMQARNDSFFFCLLGFFHECHFTPSTDDFLESEGYYRKAAGQIHGFPFEGLAQDALKKRIKPALKPYNFQKLIAEQALQYRQAVAYQVQDEALRSQILSLSTHDELDVYLEELAQQGFPAIFRASQRPELEAQCISIISWTQYARNLIQQRAYCYPALLQAIKAYHNDPKHHSRLRALKKSTSLASVEKHMDYFWRQIVPAQKKSLETLLKFSFLSALQKASLLKLLDYLKSSELLRTNLTSPVVLIHEGQQGTRVLQPEFAQKLLPEGDLVSDVAQGSHAVMILQGVHYKCATSGLVTIAPGFEYMVDRLNKLMIGHGSAPTTLLKVSQGTHQIVYQASKTVTGVDLQYLLETHPEYLDHLDRRNFSSLTVLGILTNPQDGKADNYMVEIEAEKNDEGQEKIKALHIVGIDNDMAFGESVQRKKSSFAPGGHWFQSDVRNVLFLFPQMEEPLEASFREHLLKLSPEFILIEWLKALQERNVHYERLMKQGILTEEEMTLLQLPIQLPQNLVRSIYRKLQKIQRYLHAHPEATHDALLQHVEPLIAEYYQRTRGQQTNILEGVQLIYNASLGEELQSRLQKTVKDDFHTIASRLIYESRPRHKREITVLQGIEELICEINWNQLSEEIATLLLQRLDAVVLYNPTELLHQLLQDQTITPPLILFLISQGAHLEGVPELRGYHALHTAVRAASWEIVLFLIEKGAPINGKDEAGETPLDKVVKELDVEDAKVGWVHGLMEKGAIVTPLYQDRLDKLLSDTAKKEAEKSNVSSPKWQPISGRGQRRGSLHAPPPRLQLISSAHLSSPPSNKEEEKLSLTNNQLDASFSFPSK